MTWPQSEPTPAFALIEGLLQAPFGSLSELPWDSIGTALDFTPVLTDRGSQKTHRSDAIGFLLYHLRQQWHNVNTDCGAYRQRHSLDKTKDWIKDAAAIMGQSMKSGVGRGPPPDEERPLLPEPAQNPAVRLRPACILAILGQALPVMSLLVPTAGMSVI